MAKQRKRRRQLIAELRDHINNGCPYELTFAPCGNMTPEQRKRLEEYLRHHYGIWAETWMFPWIDMIEERWLGTVTPSSTSIGPPTMATALAMAVLCGDHTAALALADLVQEEYLKEG